MNMLKKLLLSVAFHVVIDALIEIAKRQRDLAEETHKWDKYENYYKILGFLIDVKSKGLDGYES